MGLPDPHDGDLAELARALADTPYTIELDTSVSLVGVVGGRLRTFSERADRLASRYASEALHPLRTTHKVREVYESNAIEGLGMGLIETEQTIRRMSGFAVLDIARFTLAQSLALDTHVYEVVGLQYARELAELIAESKTRPITESDLRSMHRMILGDAPGSGQYKRYVNSISGSEHQPPPPSDVPAHMRELTAWLSISHVHPLVQATVAHAWLTHVHPFDDGNGRMARLVTNLVLARAGYPPIIVKASAHRQPYLEALADSDRGGDLLPLLGVFSRLLKGTFRQVENPETALGIWRKLMEDRQPSAFKRWQDESDAFISVLSEALPRQFALSRTGSLDDEDYSQLSSGPNFLAPRLARITLEGDGEFELQLIAGRQSLRSQTAIGGRQPSLRFLDKTRDPRDPKSHRALQSSKNFRYTEIILKPEALPSVVLWDGNEPLVSGTRAAADILARQITKWSAIYRSDSIRELILASDFLEPGALSKDPRPRTTQARFQRASTWWRGSSGVRWRT
jgi:Fic family protein